MAAAPTVSMWVQTGRARWLCSSANCYTCLAETSRCHLSCCIAISVLAEVPKNALFRPDQGTTEGINPICWSPYQSPGPLCGEGGPTDASPGSRGSSAAQADSKPSGAVAGVSPAGPALEPLRSIRCLRISCVARERMPSTAEAYNSGTYPTTSCFLGVPCTAAGQRSRAQVPRSRRGVRAVVLMLCFSTAL